MYLFVFIWRIMLHNIVGTTRISLKYVICPLSHTHPCPPSYLSRSPESTKLSSLCHSCFSRSSLGWRDPSTSSQTYSSPLLWPGLGKEMLAR